MRQATLLVADDLTYTLTGKLSILGVYQSDIVIPHDPYFVNQLVFFFAIETPPDDPCLSVELVVTLPGDGGERRLSLPVANFVTTPADKSRWTIKYPLLFQGLLLHKGQIEAKVIHEKGEISVAAPYVNLQPPVISPAPNSKP
jgi:hypothetical protein